MSIDRYAYAADDPVNIVDPSGMRATGYGSSGWYRRPGAGSGNRIVEFVRETTYDAARSA